jgi:hypothetical protein
MESSMLNSSLLPKLDLEGMVRAHLRGRDDPCSCGLQRDAEPPDLDIECRVEHIMASRSGKTCFVTIGATASFVGLIKATLAPDFLAALEAHGYTHLLVQYGQNGKALFDSCIGSLNRINIHISGFDLDKAGLTRYMLEAKGGRDTGLQEGVVVSHAGMRMVL